METTPASIAVCNQKGGVGKSTFTVLLASYLHYLAEYDVLVVDCDYPQWSVHAQRERELEAVEHNDYYKLMMMRQFKATGRKIWPVVRCMPPRSLQGGGTHRAERLSPPDHSLRSAGNGQRRRRHPDIIVAGHDLYSHESR